MTRTLKIGIQTIHREPDVPVGPWHPSIDELVRFVELIDRAGFDSIWVGDHVTCSIPFLDPLLMLAQAAVASRRLTFGTGVYLLPLRPVGPVAKQIATLDHLTEGRLIFGVGVGGEFPKEYELCGVPIAERGRRLNEQIGALRALWAGEKSSY
jgi:alkanesulfonate monooxygenase SsuD/methylene tetrahydromethanopterin reductase-like flavin-dependent oxidoreductase (luciferase family)